MKCGLDIALVFIGGGLGSVARAAVQTYAARLGPFPVGTLAVNLLGSFVMAVLTCGLLGAGRLGDEWRLFFATGCLGGFTTYSAFNQETVALWLNGAPLSAVAYAAATVLGCAACGGLGYALVRLFSS